MSQPNKPTMNAKDLERGAVAMVRSGQRFSAGDGIIVAYNEVHQVNGETARQPVVLHTLHAVHKFLEIRS